MPARLTCPYPAWRSSDDPTVFYYVRAEKNGQLLWRSTRCRSRRDALRRTTEREDLFKPQQPRLTLGRFAAEYETYAASRLSLRTLSGYRDTLKGFQRFVGDVPLPTLTPRIADAYISQPERPTRFFSRSEFERLLAVVKEGWLRDLILFAVSTGMRRGEILNLTWPDVDFVRKLIHIQSSATFTTKRGKRRTIPMNDLVHAVLVRKSRQMGDGHIFHRLSRQIAHSYLLHLFKRYIRLAKLDDELHGAVNKIMLELPTPERPASAEPAP